MSDDLIKFYNKELNFIRRSAAAFAEANPKIAGRLRLSQDTIEDPHVSRLIESVAFLNARVRKKLDDSFPEISNSMLEVLYPHYLAPVPSMSIIQFKGVAEATTGYKIKSGSLIETQPVDGEPCRFNTASAVTLWPIEITDAQLVRGSYQAPALPKHFGAIAVLRLKLRCMSDEMTFSQLSPEDLVFYLGGQSTEVSALYELIFNHTVAMSVAESPADNNAVYLDADQLEPVGFGKDEGLLPYPARSQLGYRLLSEYFTFSEKFNFMKLSGLGANVFSKSGNEIEIYLYLNESLPELENSIDKENFYLGCTPMVNLFSQHAESMTLSHKNEEYHVVPDSRRMLSKEVYSIDKVEAVSPTGEKMEYRPFYGFNHQMNDRKDIAYWHANRKSAEIHRQEDIDNGTEMYISLVDLNFQPDIPDNWVLNIKTTCLNRDLPGRLPFGGGQPYLQLGEGNAPLSSVQCITPPTKTKRVELRESTRWRLISHLNLNHLSLMDSEHGADVLREILTLYNFDDSPTTRSLIEGVVSIESKQVMSRVKDHGISALCRGIEITLTLDEDRF
ncbi:MAG: type VI secretion system baseplate subunit TssF, partial [Gammaproteobacteria bacterium]|nr:type VI secretion system baseplate subunit TssF [Gammaproteobacteria bacterium]